MTAKERDESAWAPLRHPLFRSLWIATAVSDIGTWMQEVGAGWLMTSLTTSPLMVALVQAAASLPVFLLVLPAGALADVVDRRRLLLVAETWMLAVAATLGALTLLNVATPWLLLSFTFLLGLGAAMSRPAWFAIVPELVPRSELPAAVSLNSAGINLARAAGPALGGLVISALGIAATFLLNAVSFLGVLIMLFRWQRKPESGVAQGERILGAVRSGVRYARHSPNLKSLLVRVIGFVFFAIALWALLPIYARQELGQGPAAYGLLLGLLGAGAVAGALLLPRARQRMSLRTLTSVATALYGLAVLSLALTSRFELACVAIPFAGVGWLAMLSTLNTSVQMVLPAWVRARGISVYLLAFFGSVAAGSSVWGLVAGRTGTPGALLISALGLLVSLIFLQRSRLPTGEGLNLAPSLHWPAPVVTTEVDEERGPVLVTVEYRIDPGKAAEFMEAMEVLRRARRRTGAFAWGLFNDVAEPERYVESYLVESWAEHLRQHDRVTVTDKEVEARVRAFHTGEARPTVTHFIHAKGRGD